MINKPPPNETKVTQILAKFFRFVGPGSPIFFVLWGPDRQFFSFCGARIANFFSFCGARIANFFVSSFSFLFFSKKSELSEFQGLVSYMRVSYMQVGGVIMLHFSFIWLILE